MHLKITDFSVRNFRSCLHAKFSPNEDLTVLIGKNGSGKSNILNALLLLRSIALFEPYRRDVEFTARTQITASILYEKRLLYLRSHICYSSSERSQEDLVSAKTEWNFRDANGRDAWVPVPLLFLRFGGQIHENSMAYEDMTIRYGKSFFDRHSDLNHEHFQFASACLKELSRMRYYSASQFTDPSKCSTHFEFDDDTLRARSPRRSAHDRFLVDLYEANVEKPDSYKEYKHIVGREGLGLVDGFIFETLKIPKSRVEVSVGGKIRNRRSFGRLVVPLIIIKGSTVSPSQLSEGTLRTLALLYYLITDNSSVVLIEEPEVCVHHGLLNDMIALIKTYSKRKQIIISTHSDYVLDAVCTDNVFLVKREEKFGTKVKPITKALSKRGFSALKSYLSESGSLGEFWREGGFDASA